MRDPRKVTEKDVRKAITDFLKLKDIFWWSNLQGLGCKPGIVDIMFICGNGYFVACEIKAPGKKVKYDSSQYWFLQYVNLWGKTHCIGIEANDVQIVIDLVEDLERRE